jgi:hypothetical protein
MEGQFVGTESLIDIGRDARVSFEHGVELGAGLKFEHGFHHHTRTGTMQAKN